MIIESLEQTPAIDFGFGRIAFTYPSGQLFKVWLNTVYPDNINVTCMASGFPVMTFETPYEWNIYYATPGTYTIYFYVFTLVGGIATTLTSNTITVTVI